MLRPGIAARALRFLGGARGGIFGRKAGEIIPAAIIFGGVRFAEIPAFGTVRRFGRRAIAGIGAAVPVAEVHLLLLARREIGSASCRARVCQFVYVSVVGVSLIKKHKSSNI